MCFRTVKELDEDLAEFNASPPTMGRPPLAQQQAQPAQRTPPPMPVQSSTMGTQTSQATPIATQTSLMASPTSSMDATR